MIRKRWIIAILLAVCMAILSLVFVSVQAEEMPEDEPEKEALAEGDFSYVEHTDTQRTQETSCQITVATECPKGFGLNTYVILSDENGQMYRISLSDENGYADQIFVKPGEYTVVETKVYDDNTGRYPFERVSEEGSISLENGEAADLRFRLSDYDKIADVIATTANDGRKTEIISENRYPTAFDGITMDGMGELYYTVIQKGSGTGSLTITGNAKGAYDLRIEIIKSGVIGEARFSLSLDGGETVIGEDVTAEKFPLKDYGITLWFSTEHDADELQEGDMFSAAIPETFAVDTARYDEANVIITGHPESDHGIEIHILSSGGRGEAKFTVSMDGGNSIAYTDTIPEDGVFPIGDEIELRFSDSVRFEKGREYSSDVQSNEESINMIPVYVMCASVIIVLCAAYGYLLSRKERMEDYDLHKWKDLQEENAYR